MKKALLILGVPLALALGCSHEVKTTRRVTEERTTMQPKPQASERTVIVTEPQSSAQTMVIEKPKPPDSTTTYQRRTEVYEDN